MRLINNVQDEACHPLQQAWTHDEKRCMFVSQISKLEVWERSQKCISDKEILFLPNFWSNLAFYTAKGFSRILLYLNFDFRPSVFGTRMKLNGLQN